MVPILFSGQAFLYLIDDLKEYSKGRIDFRFVLRSVPIAPGNRLIIDEQRCHLLSPFWTSG